MMYGGRAEGRGFKGTVPPKNDQIFKNVFLPLMKYQHVADVVVEYYSCATCVKGVGGGEVERQGVPFQFWNSTGFTHGCSGPSE